MFGERFSKRAFSNQSEDETRDIPGQESEACSPQTKTQALCDDFIEPGAEQLALIFLNLVGDVNYRLLNREETRGRAEEDQETEENRSSSTSATRQCGKSGRKDCPAKLLSFGELREQRGKTVI